MDRRDEGWLVFAAIVLGVAGIMRIFDAIWAFRYHGVLPENLEGAIRCISAICVDALLPDLVADLRWHRCSGDLRACRVRRRSRSR